MAGDGGPGRVGVLEEPLRVEDLVVVLPREIDRKGALHEEGIDAGRTQRDSLAPDLEALLTERHGPGPYVASLEGWDLYFVPGVYETLLNRPGDFDAVLGLIKRAPGMWRVYRADQLRQDNNTVDPITRAVGSRVILLCAVMSPLTSPATTIESASIDMRSTAGWPIMTARSLCSSPSQRPSMRIDSRHRIVP